MKLFSSLIILLLFLSCEGFGLNTKNLTDGTAVTDTLYVFNYDTLIITNYDTTIVNNYDTLIITNYDTTIVNNYDTLIITNYDTTFVYDTLIVLDTLIIEQMDCAGVQGGNAQLDNCGVCDNDLTNDCVQDCAGVEGGTASIDSCGLCTGGTTGLSNNYLMDCAGVCNGDAVFDNCGTCDAEELNDCLGYYQCNNNVDISLGFSIYPMEFYYLFDWQNGSKLLAELKMHNKGSFNQDFSLYYYGKINNEIVIEGETYNSYLYPNEIRVLSNANFNPYSIKTHYIDGSFLYNLNTYGHLLSGNYEIGIEVRGYNSTYCSITLDSLYQTP